MGVLKSIAYLLYPDFISIKNKILGLFWYLRDYHSFKRMNKDIPDIKVNIQLLDKNNTHTNSAGHYLLQDLFVSKKILRENPIKHVDIGSRVDGFLTQLSIFREVEVFDIRNYPVDIPNIKYKQIDFTKLPDEYYNYTDSISSLHAIEHFGLGRYGDIIDPTAHITAIHIIWKVLMVNGTFYFSVPIGPLRVEYNAHRVFSVNYLLNIIEPLFSIENFSYIDDNGILHENCIITPELKHSNFGCSYGCGIFTLKKI